MKVVVATMPLRAIGHDKTFVLDLQGAAANHAGETGAAAM
jgi:hypothetical protein